MLGMLRNLTPLIVACALTGCAVTHRTAAAESTFSFEDARPPRATGRSRRTALHTYIATTSSILRRLSQLGRNYG
jgi:hypothetical protein